MSSPSEEPVPRTITDIKLVTTFFVNEFHLGEPCNGTLVPYLLSSLSRLPDYSILRPNLRYYFRACASVSFSWFDHAVPL